MLGQPLFHQTVVGHMEPTDLETPTRDTTSYLPRQDFTNAPASSAACNVASQSSLPGHRMSIPQQLQASVPPPASMQKLLYRQPQVPQAYMQHILHREVPPPQVPPGYMQHPQTRVAHKPYKPTTSYLGHPGSHHVPVMQPKPTQDHFLWRSGPQHPRPKM
jgi:hypothetical protein